MTTGLTGRSTRRPSERDSVQSMKIEELRPHPLNEQLYGGVAVDAEFVKSVERLGGILEPIVATPLSSRPPQRLQVA